MISPYAELPDHQFWRRAVSRVEPFLLDPVIESGVKIGRADKVATAGSCFAQHISRSLRVAGFNYYVVEDRSPFDDDKEANRRNFGVFSARYGNLYTVQQLLQLFLEAFDRRAPQEVAWRRGDGRFVDAFRPQIEPDGFASVEEVHANRKAHLAAVRRMFETSDVLIFTLGLTEAWRSRADGSVFPLAPGVAGGSYDAKRHEFVNYSIFEVYQAMSDFIVEFRRINPGCRIVLTVSPVPLIATYESRHVLVSTIYSKSVLRVAAAEIVKVNDGVEYFPSYEIITGNYTRGAYYESDMREVNAIGVAHAMKVFMKHYLAESPSIQAGSPDLFTSADPIGPEPRLEPEDSNLSVRDYDDIVCDEEIIEQARERDDRMRALKSDDADLSTRLG